MCDVRFYCSTFLRAKTADCRRPHRHTVQIYKSISLLNVPVDPLFSKAPTRRTHVKGEAMGEASAHTMMLMNVIKRIKHYFTAPTLWPTTLYFKVHAPGTSPLLSPPVAISRTPRPTTHATRDERQTVPSTREAGPAQ
mgnify:CR=1 FL=1